MLKHQLTPLLIWPSVICYNLWNPFCMSHSSVQPYDRSSIRPSTHPYVTNNTFPSSSPQTLLCHSLQLTFISVSFEGSFFSTANCYLWTFVCSLASLLTMRLIAIICYSAPVLILGTGAVKWEYSFGGWGKSWQDPFITRSFWKVQPINNPPLQSN